MGYYDPYPTIQLRKPLAMIGFMGAGVQRIGHGLGARTGLPVHDVDRNIEQVAGMTRAQLVIEQGDAVRRAIEAELVEKAIRAQPPGVVMLGDGALLDPDTLRCVEESSHLVYIERPLETLLESIRRSRQRDPASIPEFIVASPRSVDDLRDYFEPREPTYARAHTRVHARDLHGSQVVDAILDELRSAGSPSASAGLTTSTLRVREPLPAS